LSIQKIYNHANVKLGLTNTTDIQFVIESLVSSTDVTGTSTGFGEIVLRVKQNLWGNDGGKTAFAIMPYISLPTSKFSESNVIQGGIVFPLAIEINSYWAVGTQVAVDMLKNTNDRNYNAEAQYSVTTSRKLASKLDAFAESSSTYNFKNADFHLSVNSGVGYSVTGNLKLDAGLSHGITKATDKVYFAGLSFRY
jgi:hypothetical protein